MTHPRSLARLEKIVTQDLHDLQKKTIFRDKDGYLVFGIYEIQPRNGGFLVKKVDQIVEEFGTLRSALAWCSANHLKKNSLCQRILCLEQERKMVAADLETRKSLITGMRDRERQDAARIKVEHRLGRIRGIENQLDECINLAKYWQIRGFNNETARTGRTASH